MEFSKLGTSARGLDYVNISLAELGKILYSNAVENVRLRIIL